MKERLLDELLNIHESLLRMIYPDGFGCPIQNIVEIAQRQPAFAIW